MANVWYCIPSKRPPEEAEPVLRQWRERGYKIALALDEGGEWASWPDYVSVGAYLGYAASVNMLCRKILILDENSEWIVTGGDDVLPDPNHTAEEIARQCAVHFYAYAARPFNSYGVMQPTGDRDFGDAQGPYIDRVAGSPWMGREFCRRMYGGRGPLCEEYWHCGEDEELQAVATMLGVFWQRPDLIHRHNHWGRPKPGQKYGQASDMPEFLKRANSQEEWKKYKAIFAARKAGGFPGHEPIP